MRVLVRGGLSFRVGASSKSFSASYRFYSATYPVPTIRGVFSTRVGVRGVFVFSRRRGGLGGVGRFLGGERSVAVASSTT